MYLVAADKNFALNASYKQIDLYINWEISYTVKTFVGIKRIIFNILKHTVEENFFCAKNYMKF